MGYVSNTDKVIHKRPTDTSSIRTLVIDDEEFQRTVLENYLTKFGYRACTVSSAEEALDFCQSLTPDLILLDLNMPGVNGIEACKQLKAIDRLSSIPVIMLTGMKDSESIRQSFDAGASDFLVKPVNELVLKQRIEYAIYSSELQKRLNKKEQELTVAQKLARIGTIEIKHKYRSVVISSNCEDLLGFSTHTLHLSYDQYISHIHPDDVDHLIYTLNRAFDERHGYIVEYRFINNNDEYIVYQKGEYIETSDNNEDHSYLIGSLQDVTEDRHARENLDYSKYYDSLTDLTNRSFFEMQIQHIIQHPPTEALFAIIFIGLDNFTRVNDAAGHKGGDEVLRTVSNRLINYETEGHTVSRFGGDVFTMLIRNIHHIDECNTLLDQILQHIKQPIHIDNNDIYITASIGASVFPLESEDGNQLLIGAEAAMMLSREEGGDRYTYRTHHMNTETQKRLTLLKEMRSAIDNYEFSVFYQPQIDACSMQIVGMEALVRWIHPLKGIISPSDFIPLAEESGLISKLGDYVIRRACSQTRCWIEAGHSLIVGVNISAVQFESDDFVDYIMQIIDETGLPACNLEIEITESMAIKNPQQTIKKLQQLRALGVKTSMDDFGTGYSSLSQLQTLPLDTLKVDQAFVKNIRKIDTGEKIPEYENSAIANAIIVMSHNLGLKVIAEGVETTDQCRFLQQQKSEILQGFLFSKPLPAEELENLLDREKQQATNWSSILTKD